MSIQPKGEHVKNAIRWISGQLEGDPSRSAMALANEAILKFDLSPKEGEELLQFYRSAAKPGDGPVTR